MKRLALLLGTAIVGIAFASPALAENPSTAPSANPGLPAPNVWQGTAYPNGKVFVYADNVWGSGPTAPAGRGCAQSNVFTRGQTVVFRAWAMQASDGKPVTDKSVKYAYVKIPGLPNQPLTFGKHGKLDSSPWFWTLGWTVPSNYPLGVVAFRIVFKTNTGVFGTFDQSSLSPNSQLTIAPSL